MMAMPQKAQAVAQLSFGSYRTAVGSSSRMEIYTIMPATKENMMPNASCDLHTDGPKAGSQVWFVNTSKGS